ncbi:MAG: PQQ-binding-like beta-propeller repeat protein [Gemmataceae bacterium]
MRTLLLATLLLAFPVLSARAGDNDWPQWRGPHRDAICKETGLLKAWPKGGPKLLWDAKKVNDGKNVGTGIASVAIVAGKLYTMGDYIEEMTVEVKKNDKVEKKVNRKGDGFVFCLDAETGKMIWKTRIGPFYYNSYGSGGRCTPTIDGDKLYALSPHGLLVCLKTADGSLVWEKSLVKEFGGRMMSGWGYSESPTIDGDRVVCTPGGKKATMVALDKNTGSTIWTCQGPDSGAGYSSIMITHGGGVKQYLTLLGKDSGLIGVDASTGKFLWSYNKIANGTANIPTALVKDDYVFTATGYGAGAVLLKLVPDGKGSVKAEEQYFLKGAQLQNHHGGMVMLGDYIYGGHGNNDGKPFCLEWKTGKFAWGPERGLGSGSAAFLYADGELYVRWQNGTVGLLDASPKGLAVKGSFEDHIARTDWPHPVIWHGRLYLRGEDQIHCFDIKAP